MGVFIWIFNRNDLSQCIVNLPKFMNICTEAIKSGNTSAINDACFIMEILIKDCIKPASTSDNIDKYSKNIQDMFTLVEDCLQPSCCDAWRQVLSVISSFIVVSFECVIFRFNRWNSFIFFISQSVR